MQNRLSHSHSEVQASYMMATEASRFRSIALEKSKVASRQARLPEWNFSGSLASGQAGSIGLISKRKQSMVA